MPTGEATVSRWSRGFVAASACWFVVWQAAVVADAARRTTVTLALSGFVFHMVFGKAYALVPSYFDRELAVARAPLVHLPLAVVGTTLLAAASFSVTAPELETVGAVLWAGGVSVFLAAIALTVRDNPLGRETGTSDHNAERRPVDRVANAAIPVVVGYLALGAYETAATPLGLPTLLGYPPATSHLLAAGTAALLVFAVGFRLLPRFLVVSAPRGAALAVLVPGAVGPAFLAWGVPSGPLLVVGAALETVAVVGFAVTFLWLFRASDRDRIGFYGVAAGVTVAVAAVGVGGYLALTGPDSTLVPVHYRSMLLGFLGLTIVGIAFQFYPPSVGRFPGAGDRLGGAVLAALTVGLASEVVGLLAAADTATTTGRVLALAGAVGYAYLILGLFVQRARE